MVKSCEAFTACSELEFCTPAAKLPNVWAAPGLPPVLPGATRTRELATEVCCTGPAEPLERLVTWVPSDPSAVLVAKSWLPFTASVLEALSWPAARLVRVRSLPTWPMLTVRLGVPPANV